MSAIRAGLVPFAALGECVGAAAVPPDPTWEFFGRFITYQATADFEDFLAYQP